MFKQRLPRCPAVLGLAAVLLTGCGGSDDNSATAASTSVAATASSAQVAVSASAPVAVDFAAADTVDVGWYANGLERLPIVAKSIALSGTWINKPTESYLYALADDNRRSMTGGNGGDVGYVFPIASFEDTQGKVGLQLARASIAFANVSIPFAIEVSTDGKAYTEVGRWTSAGGTIAEVDGEGKKSYLFQTFDIPTANRRETRFVRIRVTASAWLNVAEVRLWGKIDHGSASFAHPGYLASDATLAAAKAKLTDSASPQSVALKRLSTDAEAAKAYQSQALSTMWVESAYGDTSNNHGHKEFVENDGEAIAKQAIMWRMTGDSTYADNVMRIVDAWSTKLQSVGGSNMYLELGWGLNSFVRAIELVKHSYDGWDPAVERRFLELLDNVLLPVLDYANQGSAIQNRWFTTVEARMVIAIYLNNRYQFNRAVADFKRGMDLYVKPHGEVGDTAGRDIPHMDFQVGSIIQAAETAWQQGVDLYADERVQKMLEYQALILNGGTPTPLPTNAKGEVVWPVYSDESTKTLYTATGPSPAGPAGWEVGYHHYAVRLQLSMPETGKRIQASRAQKRSDGYVFCWGFGTLLYGQ